MLIQQTSSRKTASLWLCHVHNLVNERLGKPEFDCLTLDEKYDCGCGPEGSASVAVEGAVETKRAEQAEDVVAEVAVKKAPEKPAPKPVEKVVEEILEESMEKVVEGGDKGDKIEDVPMQATKSGNDVAEKEEE